MTPTKERRQERSSTSLQGCSAWNNPTQALSDKPTHITLDGPAMNRKTKRRARLAAIQPSSGLQHHDYITKRPRGGNSKNGPDGMNDGRHLRVHTDHVWQSLIGIVIWKLDYFIFPTSSCFEVPASRTTGNVFFFLHVPFCQRINTERNQPEKKIQPKGGPTIGSGQQPKSLVLHCGKSACTCSGIF